MELLELCLSAILLGFRGSVYQQTFGTAMGSPVSVTVVNLVMEDVEERALAASYVHPRFWKWYVDDTCTAFPANSLQRFLDHLNSAEPSICFTLEVDSEGKRPFLNILLQHDLDGSISMTVYRKPMHTDRYLNFATHHPLAHKIVRTLHSRAEAVNSSVLGKDEETRHLRQALASSSYPKGVVQCHSVLVNTRAVTHRVLQSLCPMYVVC